jgi:hypothetical protein
MARCIVLFRRHGETTVWQTPKPPTAPTIRTTDPSSRRPVVMETDAELEVVYYLSARQRPTKATARGRGALQTLAHAVPAQDENGKERML